jgi:excisionase family DNA binding protein
VTEKLLTPAQVCEQLQISRKTLQRLCATRALGFVRVGGSVRFRESAITYYVGKAERLPVPSRVAA